MKKTLTTLALALACLAATAQNGGITPDMLSEISKGWAGTPADKALRNAIAVAPINTLSVNVVSTPQYMIFLQLRLNHLYFLLLNY